MEPSELRSAMEGVLAFTPTPFTEQGELDLRALASHVEYLSETDVSTICVGGGVGEFFSLAPFEYEQCIRTATSAAAGRKPVIAGVAAPNGTAVQIAELAVSCGAAGLLVNPHNFIQASDTGLVRQYQAIGEPGLGLILYSTSPFPFSVETLKRVSEVDAVVGLKDEHGDLGLFMEAYEELGDRFAWINGMAETHAAPYSAAGATAMTSGIANFAPDLSVRVWTLARSNEWKALRQVIADEVRPIARLRASRPGGPIAFIKGAMNLIGLNGGFPRPPIEPLSDAETRVLEDTLQDLGLK